MTPNEWMERWAFGVQIPPWSTLMMFAYTQENLVGAEGNGFIQLMHFFDRSRAYVAAHGVGLAQGAMDMAIKHAKTRKQFAQPIASFQATQFKIAEMVTKIETAAI